MASGRELCYVLLSGVCLCYAMTFVVLARPTVIRCALLRVGLGRVFRHQFHASTLLRKVIIVDKKTLTNAFYIYIVRSLLEPLLQCHLCENK